MIAALGVKRGEMEKAQLATFPTEHGMVGWAPTQGHIPSGVPYLGVCRDDILAGKINRAMVIGKGTVKTWPKRVQCRRMSVCGLETVFVVFW